MRQLIALREQGEPVGPVLAEGFEFLSRTLDQEMAYWQEIRGASPVSRRDDMVREKIVPLWLHILMVDVTDNGSDYYFRVVGQRLVDAYGEQCGRTLSDAKAPEVVCE